MCLISLFYGVLQCNEVVYTSLMMFVLWLWINFWRKLNIKLYSQWQPARLLFTNIYRLIRELITQAAKNSVWSVHWLEMLVKLSSWATSNLRKMHPIMLRGKILHFTNLGNLINFLSVLSFAPVEAHCHLFRKTNGKRDVSDSLNIPISCLRDISLHIQHWTSPNKHQAPLQIHSRTIR